MNEYTKYCELMKLLQLDFCILDENKLALLLGKNRSNIKVLFQQQKDKSPYVLCRDLDNEIINTNSIWTVYSNDMFFQYTYIILGKYQYKNKLIFMEYFDNLYNALYDLNIEKTKKVLTELKTEQLNIFMLDTEQQKITEKLQNILSDQDVLSIIKRKLNDKQKFLSTFYSCIDDTENLMENIIFAVLVLKDACDINELILVLKNEQSITQYITDMICRILDLKAIHTKEEKLRFLDYIHQEFILNGYYLHGTTGRNKNNILKHGLSSSHVPIMQSEIRNINSIFEGYNLYMNFEGKMRELSLHQYYVTDRIKSAIMYALQSPEYLSRFCSNGYHMEDTSLFDREAFWRHDYKSCKRNVKRLCVQYKFKKEDCARVLTDFKVLWKNNIKSRKAPIIFIGKKNNIGRDTSQKYEKLKKNIDSYSVIEILSLFKLGENMHDKRLSCINHESLSCVTLPNVNKLYKLKSKDKMKSTQYVTHNGTTYQPDILITKAPLKATAIIQTEDDAPTTKVNEKIVKLSLTDQVTSTNAYYNIDYSILIAESGKAITQKGKEYIYKQREKYTIDYILNYNKKQIEDCVSYWKEHRNEMTSVEKTEFVSILLNQLLVKTIAMNKYRKYFIEIDAGLIRLIYYSIDIGNELNKAMRQNTVSDEIVDEIMKNMLESIERGFVSCADLKGKFYEVEPK